jgi:hypothetical protein
LVQRGLHARRDQEAARHRADPLAWGDYRAEYRLFYRLDIDGVLTDFPDAAVSARPRAAEST